MVTAWLARVGVFATLFSLFSLFSLVLAAENVTDLGKPISVPASQFWDGKDGPWSTFRVEVGSPAQQFRLLPASSQSSTWLFIPEGCSSGDENCSKNHGTLYMRNESSTWDEYGGYELNTVIEARLGLNGDGLYGYDTLTLGWTGDGLPSLEHQLLAGVFTDDFYLGSLALNPRPTNFTNYNDPIPSLMQSLRNASSPIPSTSWSYTAGAFNLAPKVFGSLVLGGYDASRFEPNQVTFPFGADISLDLQVAIQSVTTNASDKPLLSTGIISYIDTLVAEIWLPTAACRAFEDAFGLVWDDDVHLYLINDSLHDSLLAKNPVISFKVGPEISGDSVTIDMPYWNWYQTATSAYAGNASGLYFPLKRAANDSQYVLGRTFLQSAYVSADYERNIFNVSQASYPSSSTSEDIVAILPILGETPSGGNGNNNSSSKSGLGTGAIAGIAVGGAVVLAIIAAAIIFLRRRKRQTKNEEESHELEDTDIHNTLPHEVEGDGRKYEVADGEGMRHEVDGDAHHKVELSAVGEHQKPVEAGGEIRTIHEMPGDDMKYVEMEGEGHVTKKPVLGDETPVRRGTDASHVERYIEDDQAPLSPTLNTNQHFR
ncbi:acid protease [Polyplosphaeria fusca]|uniref:Acid protease n=1 Tax=Polyplosphaeria fusca TaxID=682080 RepID=A0A9P4RCD4_9PLEO|nr:acid protease [Polyplosphaeria fusca]